ncbi:MAG: cyclophilin-like fold protein [Pseudomonadota bacterium]|nr:cyclophilin-like fold protein [Pseudomonadota bacterium]
MIRLLATALVAAHIPLAAPAQSGGPQAGDPQMTAIRFVIGDTVLSATLDDTAPARDFASMLPMDLTLSPYHGVEMVGDLGRELDSAGMPGSYEPKTGDITQYAPWKNLAIFTAPFSDSRGLVRLGQFDGPIDALTGAGDVTVRIELEN